MHFDELNKDNFLLFAIKNYNNPTASTQDDFDEDYTLHTEPPQCMPDEFKCDDYVEAYRAYYRKDKAHILKWTNREQPDWI